MLILPTESRMPSLADALPTNTEMSDTVFSVAVREDTEGSEEAVKLFTQPLQNTGLGLVHGIPRHPQFFGH